MPLPCGSVSVVLFGLAGHAEGITASRNGQSVTYFFDVGFDAFLDH